MLTWVAGDSPVNITSGVVLVTTTGGPPFKGVAVKVYCKTVAGGASTGPQHARVV